jgi:hypothetical protein
MHVQDPPRSIRSNRKYVAPHNTWQLVLVMSYKSHNVINRLGQGGQR